MFTIGDYRLSFAYGFDRTKSSFGSYILFLSKEQWEKDFPEIVQLNGFSKFYDKTVLNKKNMLRTEFRKKSLNIKDHHNKYTINKHKSDIYFFETTYLTEQPLYEIGNKSHYIKDEVYTSMIQNVVEKIGIRVIENDGYCKARNQYTMSSSGWYKFPFDNSSYEI